VAPGGRIYRLTDLGHKALAIRDAAVPAEYQRIMVLIEPEAHLDVIRGLLRHFPDVLLIYWLEELVELGYLEFRSDGAEHDLDFTRSAPRRPTLVGQDAKRLEVVTNAATATLVRVGSYLAEERLTNQRPLGKAPADTAVLIVEDDPDQLALASLRLTMAGYRVMVAESANTLLLSLQKYGKPDMLVLDVMLPDGNGFDILAKMRAHPAYALLPIVLLTASTQKTDIRKGLALGADGYVTKPYSKNVLAETIGRVLKLVKI
jgi:CheY-like chemotaxis protein